MEKRKEFSEAKAQEIDQQCGQRSLGPKLSMISEVELPCTGQEYRSADCFGLSSETTREEEKMAVWELGGRRLYPLYFMLAAMPRLMLTITAEHEDIFGTTAPDQKVACPVTSVPLRRPAIRGPDLRRVVGAGRDFGRASSFGRVWISCEFAHFFLLCSLLSTSIPIFSSCHISAFRKLGSIDSECMSHSVIRNSPKDSSNHDSSV